VASGGDMLTALTIKIEETRLDHCVCGLRSMGIWLPMASDKGPVRGIGCSPKAFPFEKRCHGVVQAAPWPSTKPNLGKTG
ncbi:hypothetical protein, partial [Tropicimonas sp. IMCC6043]|uniref:hypothetical protein n=1 Tax=Tropicimonas sp. IMCC6043 TaxID=2510645 RepID=UPI001A91B968